MIYLLKDFEKFLDQAVQVGVISIPEYDYVNTLIAKHKEVETQDDSEETNKGIDHEKDSPF